MSELEPWKQNEKQARKIINHPAYQSAVTQLLYNCRAKTSHDSTTTDPPSVTDVSRDIDLDPWVQEPMDDDEPADWENLLISVYPEGFEDDHGYENLAVVELVQDVTDNLEFVKEYQIVFCRGNYYVWKHNFLFDYSYNQGSKLRQDAYTFFNNFTAADKNEVIALDNLIEEAR